MTPSAADTPTLFALHGLGLSRHLFDALARELDGAIDVVALDLPGFGDERDSPETSVEQMTESVVRRIREHSARRWLIAGHSMGGKIASLVAERTMSGRAGLFGLAGVVLIAGSPLSPEPMAEEQRRTMLGWVDDGPLDEDQARTFLEENVGAPLAPAFEKQALADLLRTSPDAWREWLETGSRTDYSGDTSAVPALLIAGGEDGDLGEDAQRRTNGSTYPRARLVTFEGAGHLIPVERPVELAAAIRAFWAEEAGTGPVVPGDASRAIASARTSSRMRAVLAERALADDPDYEPQVLTPAQLTTLRAVAGRVVPQDGPAIDLAARVDSQLAEGAGDGWRNAALPADALAYGLALDALAGFETLADQDAALRDLGTSARGALSADQLAAWFEDCRVDLVRQWLAHPATMARIGYDGYATGGDTALIPGFRLLGADEREPWEPTTRSHR